MFPFPKKWFGIETALCSCLKGILYFLEVNIGLKSCKKYKVNKAGFLGIALIFFAAIWLFLTFNRFPGDRALHSWLLERVVRSKPLPDRFNELYPESGRVIYVLGGSAGSLEHRFKAAADLYQKGIARKILVLSEPGITEYDPFLKRNLTNDEWAVKELTGFGVPNGDVDLVIFKKSFFGTFGEAKNILELASKNGYDPVILVTSQYHTLRTWETFSKILSLRGISVYIYSAEDPIGLRGLLYEYLKLTVYENFVLPMYAEPKTASARGVWMPRDLNTQEGRA